MSNAVVYVVFSFLIYPWTLSLLMLLHQTMHEFSCVSFQETQTLHVEGLCLDIDNMVLDFKTSINVVFLFFLSYFIVVYLILFHYLDFCLPGFF